MILEAGSDEAVIRDYNRALLAMTDDAYFDMEGEGFKPEAVSLTLEVEMTSGNSSDSRTIQCAPVALTSPADIKTLSEMYTAAGLPGEADEKVLIKELRLQAACQLPSPEFSDHAPAGDNPEQALKGQRSAWWDGKFRDVPVYDQGLLECGNIVRGFAFVESADTTVLVPPGSRYLVDRHLNGVMEEE
jgi:N-methylhydantoinase A/oxoprolinase/acetone carboxylase beta subunit